MTKTVEKLLGFHTLKSKVNLDLSVTGITHDSRTASEGQLYFVIPGHSVDGSSFVSIALKKNVAALVVEATDLFSQYPNTILVESTRKSLAHAACEWHGLPTQHLNVVGITGTNGKTTSTFLLRSIWDAHHLTSGFIGTVEYRLGEKTLDAPLTTPGSLQLQELFSEMLGMGVTHASMEVSSIALDQSRSDGIHFKTALFTNLTQDHLDYHGSFEKYYQAKRRLFIECQPEFSVINTDDEWGQRLYRELPSTSNLISYGINSNGDIHAVNPSFSLAGFKTVVSIFGKKFPLHSPLIGKHNLMNCLGVLAVSETLNLAAEKSIQALSQFLGTPGRLERVVPEKNHPSIFVDYAHTPDALRNVLSALQQIRAEAHSRGRIITIFGCGGDRDKLKRPMMGAIASELSDVTVVTSDNPRTENPEEIIDGIEKGIRKSGAHFRDSRRREAIHLALKLANPEDIILIAGKGHETYQTIGNQKLSFDDREVIREYYGS